MFANVPAGTAALALVLDDPDAPGGTWDHWVRWNLEISDGIAEGASSTKEVGEVGVAGTNSFRNTLYGGPCPPSGEHRYFFKLYALDAELDLAAGATKGELEAAMEGHILAQAELIGLYSRD